MSFYLRLWQAHGILYFSAVIFITFSLLILQYKSKWLYKRAENLKSSCADEKYLLQVEDRKNVERLLLSQGHAWEPSAAAIAQYRAELRKCCNATFSLVLTKANTPKGMKYITNNDTFTVKAKLIKLLPKKSPFLHSQYENCAVVGNSQILHNSYCGQKIDQADLVVRFNIPPLNFPVDVGTKTSLLTISPDILLRYQWLKYQRKPFVDALRAYSGAAILLPDFFYKKNVEASYRVVYTMEDAGFSTRAFFLNPLYQTALRDYWKKKCFPHPISPVFTLVSMALEFCQDITLYGFWPFSDDPTNQSIPHHYYGQVLSKMGLSGLPSEFSYYLHLYAQGVLQLQVGKCQKMV